MINSISLKTKIVIAVVIILAAAASVYSLITRNQQFTDDAAIETNIATSSAKISGYVISVEINDNQKVKTGDILLTIDPRDYQHKLAIAQANYDSAEATYQSATQSLQSTQITAPSSLESAKFQVESARSKWVKAAADLKRINNLDDLVRSKQQVDEAVSVEQSARSDLDDSIARLKSAQIAPTTVAIAQSKVRELEADLAKAKASVALAQLDLDNTKVLAPFDGRVTKRNVEVGNYVQPGQKLLAIVSDNYWVLANYKETQVTKMRIGQTVDIKIDAFPDKIYSGKIDSIQAGTGSRFSMFPPENATGNYVKVIQRVPVKIIFDTLPDPNLPVGAGMSVEPTVYTE